jgi:aryl-alcohol dehydrogenase-like predicted oxidoreductase
MQKRALGKSGLSIAPLVFGGNVFGWTADEATSFKLLDAFVEAGGNMIDTADAYSTWVPGNVGGESESIIGKWLKASGKRSRVLIATKVGMQLTPENRGLKRARVIQAAEESLKRLQTDVIDLYQTHKDDESTPVEETLEAYAQLIRQGKVRAIGASQMSPARLRESLDASQRLGLPAYASLQPLYNLYDRAGFERDYAPICRERGLGVINYYSLAAGFLSGKYRTEADLTKSPRGATRIRDAYLNDRGLKIISALEQVSKRLDVPMASVAVAWVLANPDITAPIASATSLDQLKQLFQAIELKLDAEALRALADASSAQ